jgi:hypothetical protein
MIRNEILNIVSLKNAMEMLLRRVAIRDQMGGALYWNILNEECCLIADRCAVLGGDKRKIGSILGEGNFTSLY